MCVCVNTRERERESSVNKLQEINKNENDKYNITSTKHMYWLSTHSIYAIREYKSHTYGALALIGEMCVGALSV